MKKLIVFYLLLNFISVFCDAQSNDTVAIKNLLQKESATWRSGDEQAHADCWKVEPYSVILISTADGNFYNVSPAMILHPMKGSMGKGGTAVNEDYHFCIDGDKAWVSHKEISTAADGVKTYSYELRMLEKYKGAWKLTGQSIHLYKNP